MSSQGDDTDADAAGFYCRVLRALDAAGLPFLVGGAFAFTHFTGIERNTKDLDLFIRGADYARMSHALASAGFATELTHPHWLAKVCAGEAFVDVIFSSGNGVADVDDGWFAHAADGELLGHRVRIAPAEETIWSKAFVMERERYDGADVAHLLCARAEDLDWPRLVRRFGAHWRVLLAHLVLFGFIYPDRREAVPGWVMQTLLGRLNAEPGAGAMPGAPICRGTLLSREQYLFDVERLGYADARIAPLGAMTEDEAAAWTEAIPRRAGHAS
jgi:hypothetical protein